MDVVVSHPGSPITTGDNTQKFLHKKGRDVVMSHKEFRISSFNPACQRSRLPQPQPVACPLRDGLHAASPDWR